MKIINVVGARPNFIKAAPLVEALLAFPHVEDTLLHTGQHYDDAMSKVFFEDLHLPRPEVDLGVGSGSHAVQTAEVMVKFEQVLLERQPDLIVVYGDVNSTLACTLAASKLAIPTAHVEAGVRSFDRSMPEEINRVVTDALSNWLFTPSHEADTNLSREGIPNEKIHFVGNIMVDTLLKAMDTARPRRTWQNWNLSENNYALVTLHRPSNVDDPAMFSHLIETLGEVSIRLPVLFPIHPRSRKRIAEFGLQGILTRFPRLLLVEPQGYLDFLCLQSSSKLILSDSGGIQAEACVLGVPALILRENTEWQVTIDEGTNTLVGTSRERILAETDLILKTGGKAGRRPELWDGKTAERIVQILVK